MEAVVCLIGALRRLFKGRGTDWQIPIITSMLGAPEIPINISTDVPITCAELVAVLKKGEKEKNTALPPFKWLVSYSSVCALPK